MKYLIIIVVAVLCVMFLNEQGCRSADMIKAAQPRLPLDITFRDSVLGFGQVMIVKNNGYEDLQVILQCQNNQLNDSLSKVIWLPANKISEFGWAELFWQFEAGERFNIRHDNYRTLSGIVPSSK